MIILHVDDERDIREIVKLALEMEGGIEVESVGSGEEALGVVDRKAHDLLLLDVMMPGMSGPTLKKTLNKDPGTKDLPVIFMTAAAQMQTRIELLALGALGVIEKPFDPMTLSSEIRKLMPAA